MKLTLSIFEQRDILDSFGDHVLRKIYPFCRSSTKNAQTDFNYKETPEKPQLMTTV